MPNERKLEKDPLIGQKQVLRQLGIGRTTFHKRRVAREFPAAEVRSDAGYEKKWRQSQINDYKASLGQLEKSCHK